MGKIVRGYWDCQYCGATGISGDKRECTGCGHPRDESVTFYMKEVEYLSDDEASKVSKNADWYCSYCNTLNSDNDSVCKSCGASREDSEKNYFDLQKEKNKPKEEFVPIQQEAPKKKFTLWPFIIVGAIIILLFCLFRTKTKDAAIEAFSWERSVDIEEYQQVKESAWSKDEIPADGEIYEAREEEHPTEKELIGYRDVEVEKSREVLDGYDEEKSYKDLGNGNFEEVVTEVPRYRTEYYTEVVQEPIYIPVVKTHYYYTVWRWNVINGADTSGEDQNPYYAEPALKDNQRLGMKHGRYYIDVKIKKKTKKYEVSSEDVWNALKKGQEVVIKSSAGSSALYDKNDNFLSNLN